VEVVLGVSMTPAAVRMVLVEGADADGVTVDHLSLTGSVEQVVAAILGTRESAIDSGHKLVGVGVAWTDHAAAARLREALRPLDIAEVTLVSELHAASALAVAIGRSTGCRRTALLFVEQDLATLAVVQTEDGAVVRVSSRSLADSDAAGDVIAMVGGLETLSDPPQTVFVVGPGAGVDALTARLAASTSLPVRRPDDAELALARGAALAGATVPRFDAETVGLGSATGWFREAGAAPDPQAATEAGPTLLADSGWALGYSAVGLDGGAPPEVAADPGADNSEDLHAVAADGTGPGPAAPEQPAGRPPLLLGSALTTLFVVGFMALVISLAVTIRPAVDSRPAENPTGAGGVPATPETIRAPVPVVQEAPRAVVAPMPAPAVVPAPVPAAPPLPAAPAAPAAPAPAPAFPAAPIPGPAAAPPPALVPEVIAALLPPVVRVPQGASPAPRYTATPAAPETSSETSVETSAETSAEASTTETSGQRSTETSAETSSVPATATQSSTQSSAQSATPSAGPQGTATPASTAESGAGEQTATATAPAPTPTTRTTPQTSPPTTVQTPSSDGCPGSSDCPA